MSKKGINQPESFIAPGSEHGLLRSSSGTGDVWLYARIPWSAALMEGASDGQRVTVAEQLMSFFDGLAGMVTVAGMKYRYLFEGQYREFHILTTAMPVPFSPPSTMRGSRLGRWLTENYRIRTQKQNAFVGVRLTPGGDRFGGRHHVRPLERFVSKLNDFAYSIANGVPQFDEYLPDLRRVESVMLNAGLEPFSRMSRMEMAECVGEMKSWWVPNAHSSAFPVLPENDHLHFFPDVDTARAAKRLYDKGVGCRDWNIPQEYPASIFFARSSDFSQNRITDPSNEWVARLLAVHEAGGANAVGVSIRGLVEPPAITAQEIRRNSMAVRESISQRMEKGNEASGDMEEIYERLEYKKAIYRHKDMPPTLVNLSVAVCAAGDAEQARDALSCVGDIDFVHLNTAKEQLTAFQSMQVCSPVRKTPYELQWAATVVAGSGISSFARGGDRTGALLGLTEANRQPVYIGTTTVQDADRKPFLGVVGDTGSGKTMVLLSLAFQWAMILARNGGGSTPVIMVNPKTDADFTDAVKAFGGDVYNMDSDLANGVFDPISVIENREDAKDIAVSMLTDILDPSRSNTDIEVALTEMLDYGIRCGAKSCGTALETAYRAFKDGKGHLPPTTPEVRDKVMHYALSNQMFRLVFGTSQETPHLRVSQNITLIQAGSRDLIPSGSGSGGDSMVDRVKQWVLRMTVLGAGAAVRGRDGMVILDEAWIALGRGAGDIIETWARLARQQRFTPVLASQKVQEFIDAGLEGAFSRLIELSMSNPVEKDGAISPAKAALRLAGIEDSQGIILSRMPIQPEMENGHPDWRSMQRLREGSKTIRGSVCAFKDGSKAPVFVENIIAPGLLKLISTSAKDIIAREQEKKKESTQ